MDTKTLFFADDDLDDLLLMQGIADSLGHLSYTFQNPTEMLRVLEQGKIEPDVIFIDIIMPKVDGYEILSAIRLDDKFPDIPVVIHSANCDEVCISKCFDLDANYFLPKAFSYDELKNSIAYAIDTDWATFKPGRESFLHQS